MNFTGLLQTSTSLCSFSPDGQYFATVDQHRLVIRSSTSAEILHLFTCIDKIDTIEWASDSRLILGGLIERNVVQIFSLDFPEWKCKIDEGTVGLCQVHWAPDSRHILTTAQFHIRITVWSLTSKNVSYMKYPKKISPTSYVFSSRKPLMALAERRSDHSDHISIFDYSNHWSVVGHFRAKHFQDLQGIQWSPIDDVLCLWENCSEYEILFYSLTGKPLRLFRPENDDHLSLGVRCAQWSPTGQLLIVGDYNSSITIFVYLTYQKLCGPIDCPRKLKSGHGYVILKEEFQTDDENEMM